MKIIHTPETPILDAGDGSHLREVLHPRNTRLPLPYSLAQATLEPGETTVAHKLFTSTEVYLILTGHGIMHIFDEAREVGPGDIVYIPPAAPQFIVNPGPEALSFYCIVSPPWREEDDIRC